MNYTYRIYPDLHQSALMLDWLETSRKVYNRALRELKDWINSRKCLADRCSIEREYIIPADAPFPSYHQRIYASREGRKETSDILEGVQFNPQKTRRLL